MYSVAFVALCWFHELPSSNIAEICSDGKVTLWVLARPNLPEGVLEDRPHDSVLLGQALQQPKCRGAPAPAVRMPSRRLWAPLHFGHRGGCASSRLDHSVDLPASRTKFSGAGDMTFSD